MKIGDLLDIRIDSKLYPMEVVTEINPGTFLCVFEDCMRDIHYMNSNKASCPYQVSDMIFYLNEFNRRIGMGFFDQYELIPFEYTLGDGQVVSNFFRLLTVDEIYGKNHYSYFDIPENVVAKFNGVDNISYWLQDTVDSDTYACVSYWGQLRDEFANFELGVRLACVVRSKFDNEVLVNEENLITDEDTVTDATKDYIIRVVLSGAHAFTAHYHNFDTAVNDLTGLITGTTMRRFTDWWYNEPDESEFNDAYLHADRLDPTISPKISDIFGVETENDTTMLDLTGEHLVDGLEYYWDVSFGSTVIKGRLTDTPWLELSKEESGLFNLADVATVSLYIEPYGYKSETYILEINS